MKKIILNACILTPVFIESGNRLTPMEYFVKEEKNRKMLIHFSLPGLLYHLNPAEKRQFYSLVNSEDIISLRNFILSKIKNNPDKFTVFKVAVTDEFYNEYKKSINSPENKLEINLFYRNELTQNVYIPGSSIKGAVRTAILNSIFQQLPKSDKNWLRDIKGGRKLESILLEKFSYKDDPFKYIYIEDVNLSYGKSYIFTIKNYNLNKDNFIGVKIYSEGLASGIEFEIKITLFKQDNLILNEKFITGACKTFYHQIMQYEISKDLSFVNKYYEDIKAILNKNRDRFLIRIGRYTHCETKTFPKSIRRIGKRNIYGKSRMLIEGEAPAGWILLWK